MGSKDDARIRDKSPKRYRDAEHARGVEESKGIQHAWIGNASDEEDAYRIR